MFCKNCGTQLKDTQKFCPMCGTPVEGKTKPNHIYETEDPFSGKSQYSKNYFNIWKENPIKTHTYASTICGVVGIIAYQTVLGYILGLIGVILFAVAKLRNGSVKVSASVVILPLIAMVLGSVTFAYNIYWIM